MKKLLVLAFTLLSTLVLVACGEDKQADIVTTMFPQYDFARQIVGDKMTVSLLTPPGVEPHAFEATSKDMVAIQNAKLFIFTSFEMDTWITDVQSIVGANTLVLNLSESFTFSDHDHDHDHHEEDAHTHVEENEHTHIEDNEHTHIEDNEHTHDHDHDHDELHFWTDPTTVIQLIEAILSKIIEIDPDNQAYYEENAHDYIHEIEELHIEIDTFFQNPLYKDSTVYFAGHNAMEAFAERYHFNIVSLFPSFKPDQDLTSAQLQTFINLVKTNQVRYLFIEELVEPRAAQTIVSELQKENYTLELLVLHGYHNLTRDELNQDLTYLDLLERNFEYLKMVLESAS